MSSVNYTIVAFDDVTLEYVVAFNDDRINVPAVVVDNAVDATKTKEAIASAIKVRLSARSPQASPSNYVDLVGASAAVGTSSEEV